MNNSQEYREIRPWLNSEYRPIGWVIPKVDGPGPDKPTLVLECKRCSSLVADDSRARHDEWHRDDTPTTATA